MTVASTAAYPGVVRRRAVSPRRDTQAMEAMRPPSPWLMCVGVVAVGPDILVSGVFWLLALAVLPGVVACAALAAVLLVTMAVRRPALGARVLLGARAATPTERDALQPALARLADSALTETLHVDVFVRRGRHARARTAIALRSGPGSNSWVLVVTADLGHAATTGPCTTEVSTLMAHAIGRHEAAGRFVGRCVLAHAAWCLPLRLMALAAERFPSHHAAAVRHLVGVAGAVVLMALAQDVRDGRLGPGCVLALPVSAYCLRRAARHRWQTHLDNGGAEKARALHRRSTPGARHHLQQQSLGTTRDTQLRLVPTEPPI